MLERTLVLTAALVAAPAAAAGSHSGETRALQRQIQALTERVAALESARTFTGFMPDFAERFHVMHRAGEVGDWAVATHELLEMRRLTEIATIVDAKNGKLMQAMMGPSFERLEQAIEHGNAKRFQAALVHTVEACNGCHVATGSPFIKVSLDVPDALNMRHPHKLAPQEAPGGHRHGHGAPR